MTMPLIPGRDIPDPELTDPVSQVGGPPVAGTTSPSISPLPGYNVVDPQLTGTQGSQWVFPVAGANQWNRSSWMPNTPRPWQEGRTHPAIDIFAAEGTPVVSPVSGTVMAVGINTSVGGNWVQVRGDDGVVYYYAHLHQPPTVSKGQRVAPGSYLGGVGTTGSARGTSPHLHFSMKFNGAHLDPRSWLESGAGSLAATYTPPPGTGAPAGGVGAFPALDGSVSAAAGQAPPRNEMTGLLTRILDGLSNAVAGGVRLPVSQAPALPGQAERDVLGEGPNVEESDVG